MKDKSMNRLITLSTALLLTLSVSQGALAQGKGDDKPGKGGGEHAQGHGGNPGKGNGNGNGGGKDKGRGDGPRADKGQGGQQASRGEDRQRGPDRNVAVIPNRDRDRDRDIRRADLPRDRDQQVAAFDRDTGLMRGCPPGLAKKNNGCLPPGQAKKLDAARYEYRWGQANESYVNRYDDGYQYRYDRQGSLLGYLPALGGALSAGNLWPTQYGFDPAPRSQLDYYRLNDSYDYRYADGAIYGVDPKTAMIRQVVALVTGQSPSVGQPLPAGYDVYNVPYAYRDQYADTPTTNYRYNDGAIYQVDPKTQLIMAVVQLLAQRS